MHHVCVGLRRLCLGSMLVLGLQPAIGAQETELELWPGTPPGRIAALRPESDTSDANSRQVAERPVVRLGNVSRPMVTFYPAPKENNSRLAVLVCPGGGYNILAYDLEGIEVCQWLNSIGCNAVLLKYRVPRANGESRPIEALQDAQRAMGLVRQRADHWGIEPTKIGVLGFSAGGHLAARLSTNSEKRAYEPVDAADAQSCRPDFTVLIYPAYLFDSESAELTSKELPISEGMPPTFISMSLDDPVDSENALRYALAMKRAKAAVELHLYPTGGHGYGLRPNGDTATTWPDRAGDWLEQFKK